MEAFLVEFPATGKTLTMFAEDGIAASRRLDDARMVIKLALGVADPVPSVIRKLPPEQLTSADRDALRRAVAESLGRPSSPYRVKHLVAALTFALGSEVVAGKVLEILESVPEWSGSVPSSIAEHVSHAAAGVEPLQPVHVSAADRVQAAARGAGA